MPHCRISFANLCRPGEQNTNQLRKLQKSFVFLSPLNRQGAHVANKMRMSGRKCPTVGFHSPIYVAHATKKRLKIFLRHLFAFLVFERQKGEQKAIKWRFRILFAFSSPFHRHFVAILSLRHLDIAVGALSWRRCGECEFFSPFSRPWATTCATRDYIKKTQKQRSRS